MINENSRHSGRVVVGMAYSMLEIESNNWTMVWAVPPRDDETIWKYRLMKRSFEQSAHVKTEK